MRLGFIVLTALAATGCGTVGAEAHPKVEVSYYSSAHLWDDGSTLEGTVCFHRTEWELASTSTPAGGVDLRSPYRHVVIAATGPNEHLVGGTFGPTSRVDLRFGPDHLVGRIAWQQFNLHREGDHLIGTYQLNADLPVTMRLDGMDQLWALPLAEQAVLLPNLLRCTTVTHLRNFTVDLTGLRRIL